MGVSAQEMQKIAPYMVGKTHITPDSNDEYLCVNSGPMTYMLINAVKELHAIIDAMKSDIATLGSGRNHEEMQ